MASTYSPASLKKVLDFLANPCVVSRAGKAQSEQTSHLTARDDLSWDSKTATAPSSKAVQADAVESLDDSCFMSALRYPELAA